MRPQHTQPPSTVGHDCPNTVFEESCTANCSYGNAAISGTGSSTVLTCGSDGAWVSDPTPSYPICEGGTSCSTALGPDASWTMGESCAVTYVEGCQAANETSGTSTCAHNDVAGDVVLEAAVPKCRSVVCQRVSVTSAVTSCLRAVVWPLAQWNISTTSSRCRSSGEFVSEAPTVYPSCPQMLCSDTLTQSGVGVSSTCGGAPIGDTCLVFVAEGYHAVSNDTSILTCATETATTTRHHCHVQT